MENTLNDLPPYPPTLPTLWNLHVYNVHHTIPMISSTTPYKLAEIIQDTWPQLYRPMKGEYNNQKEEDASTKT
jgi:hypothetical protein